ncbi:hypothetical protein [Acanthopleuribacter pedis]|uniref:Uncharacterized protein n=1 Tax=Acanthopleuribacter pedis TaxID=442870 RepID=A0A8J7QK83_9BACT|nr:hypothetical protein [Acanthopleuribacter pedis]MBO1319675.1 hypothetical protein [Acanthopleuribacter pedis]
MGNLGWGKKDKSPTDGFSDKEVGKTCVGCEAGQEPLSDMDLDGVIMGRKDGACAPLTKKNEALTRATIQGAKEQAFTSNSNCCKGKHPPDGVADKTIVYVNGIRTQQGGHCQTLQDVADTTCAKVIGVYNATRNSVADLWQAKQDKSWIKKHAADAEKDAPDEEPRMSPKGRNPAVDTLRDMIYAEASSDQEMEIFAHSQGGAITSVALYEAEKQLAGAGMEENMSKVSVTSMGSAAQQWPDGPEYTHLIHARDFTPVKLGLRKSAKKDASRAGKGAKVVRFVGEPGGGSFKEMEPGDDTGGTSFTKYHDVDQTYLKAQSQFNNGCRGKS